MPSEPTSAAVSTKARGGATQGQPTNGAHPRRASRRRFTAKQYAALVELSPDATVVTDADGTVLLANRQVEVLFGYAREDLLGQSVELLIPERYHADHRVHRSEYAAAPNTRPMGTQLLLVGRRRDGSEFQVEVSLSPFQADDEELVVATIRDVSEVQRVQATNRELQRLIALTDTALAHLTLEELLPELLAQVRDVMEVDNVVLLLVAAGEDGEDDHAEGLLVVRAAHGMPDDVAEAMRVPVGVGFAGRIAATRAPLVVDDLTTFPVFSAALRDRPGIKSVAGVPLLLGDQLLGVLHVGTTRTRRFSELDVTLLERVAARVTCAVERAQLYTAEKQARMQAVARSDQLEAVLNGMTDSVSVFDAQGRITYVNAAYRTLLALDARPDFTQLSARERSSLLAARTATGEPLAEDQFAGARLLRGEVLVGTESPDYILNTLDGRTVTVQVAGSPLWDAAGNISGAVLVMRDVTAARQLEAAALALGAQLGATLDAMDEAVFLYDVDGRVLRLNAAARAMVGATAETDDFYSRPLRERGEAYQPRWPDGRPLAQEDWPLSRVLRGEVLAAENALDMLLTDAQGRERVMNYMGGPVHAAQGQLIGYVFVVHDVTERRQVEREREEARASELAARELAQQLDQFFAMASHDIRSPLTALSGNVQIARTRAQRLSSALQADDGAAQDAALASSLLGALDRADESVGSVLRLVTVLFDVARARTGTLTLTLAPCNLVALVRKQVALQRAAVPGRSIQVEAPDEAVMVSADAVRLEQVLTNYLTNALKYSSDDQPVIVRLEATHELAVVSVQDHGPGLPWEEQSRIWELYHRAPGVEVQGSAGASSGSLGLGLHICKRLVELHPGGKVGVESAVGQGSTFWFRLPLADSAEAGGPAA